MNKDKDKDKEWKKILRKTIKLNPKISIKNILIKSKKKYNKSKKKIKIL